MFITALIFKTAADAGAFTGRTCLSNVTSKLQILHSSDNESSFQNPNTLEAKVLNYSAVVKGLRKVATRECIPYLHLTAGDHTIRGPFYQASEGLMVLRASAMS